MQYKIVFSLGLLAMTELVAGHGAIVKAVGDAGGNGSAIGSELRGTISEYLELTGHS